jgi:HlyD family secretion protein
MLIVPRADKLVVQANVAPHDIDQSPSVRPRRCGSGPGTMLPDVREEVIHVSADLTQPGSPPGQVQQDRTGPSAASQTGQALYQVRMSLLEQEVQRLGDLRLVPGMPVEAFILTLAKTPWNSS